MIAPEGTVFTAIRPAADRLVLRSVGLRHRAGLESARPGPARAPLGRVVRLALRLLHRRHARPDGRLLGAGHAAGWRLGGRHRHRRRKRPDRDHRRRHLQLPGRSDRTRLPADHAAQRPQRRGRRRRGAAPRRLRHRSASSASTTRPAAPCSPSSGAPCSAPGASTADTRAPATTYEVVRANGERIRGGRVTSLPLAEGDLVRIVTGNGGGWGDPGERERDLRARRPARRLHHRGQATRHLRLGSDRGRRHERRPARRRRYRRHLHRRRRLRRGDRPRLGEAKASTTPGRLRGWRVRRDGRRGDQPRSDIAAFVHGTTVVINAITQRRGVHDGAGHDRRLPRRAGDRARQPARHVQPASSTSRDPSCPGGLRFEVRGTGGRRWQRAHAAGAG